MNYVQMSHNGISHQLARRSALTLCPPESLLAQNCTLLYPWEFRYYHLVAKIPQYRLRLLLLFYLCQIGPYDASCAIACFNINLI